MIKNKANIAGVCAVGAVWLTLSLWSAFKPADAMSISERRQLAAFPEVTAESLLSGKFMTDFETYSLDQFPMRDEFRTLKAITSFYLFGKKDNNDIYIADGYAAKIEYPMNKDSVTNAAGKFTYIYDKYLKDSASNVYLSIVPDKGYFLADKYGYPSMDYSEMVQIMKDNMTYAEYIDIFPELSINSYYKTDTHWRQEKIVPVARKISEAMGAAPLGDYTTVKTDVPFYGVYYGQSALPLDSESIYYVENPTLTGCTVTNVETGKVYTGTNDFEKLNGKDPYEMYLSGACAVMYIDNPNAATDKELVVFRDSFGSSLIPLLTEGYSRITILDTRYIIPDLLGNFAEFENADVLFLYSTSILNQSSTLR